MAGLEAPALGRPFPGRLHKESTRAGTGRNRVVCPPGDVRKMAHGITRLMKDDAFCVDAGTRVLCSSRQTFGPEMHLASLEADFQARIQGRTATSPAE
jgi:hypothetical protein